jgi:hypothetical protein
MIGLQPWGIPMNTKPGARVAKPAICAVAAIAMLPFAMPRELMIPAARAATQNVRVVNTEARPVPVVPAYELFQTRVVVGITANAVSASGTFTVPGGVRLVLENITGLGAASGIDTVTISQSQANAVLPVTPVGGSWKWLGTTPTKVIFNAGNVTVAIRRPTAASSCTTCTSFNYITLTGYLMPASTEAIASD